MKKEAYLIISKSGVMSVRKTKPTLNWNEIAVKVKLNIPDELFLRPHLEATITVDKDKIKPTMIHPDIIINTAELIEQQTGAKIDFSVVEYPKETGEVKDDAHE